jgi:hypothetical protein
MQKACYLRKRGGMGRQQKISILLVQMKLKKGLNL